MATGWAIAVGLIIVAAAAAGTGVATGSAGIIAAMAAAIQSFEGWRPGSVSFRNNNPGNLKYANQKGAVGCDAGGFAVFPTYEAGRQALCTQLAMAFNGTSRVYTPEDTLYDFFSKYTEGDSIPYANFVADKLGVTAHTRLKDIAPA